MENILIDSKSFRLPDGPGFSPDGGSCWVKGEKIYWSSGHVTDNGMYRFLPSPGGEDYSLWSAEHRAKVLAEHEARAAQWQAEADARQAVIDKLRASARAKLTPEEIMACKL